MRTTLTTLLVALAIAVPVGVPPAGADTAEPAAGCFSGTFADPVDDDRIDVAQLVIRHSCETNVLRFDINTHDTFSPTQLYTVAIGFDTDSDPQTGCRVETGGQSFGSDFSLISQRVDTSGNRTTDLWETPSCNDAEWRNRGPAYFEFVDGNSVRLEVTRARLGDPSSMRTGAYVEDIFEQTFSGDVAPDNGVTVQLGGPLPACTRCFYLTNQQRGGAAWNVFAYGRADDVVFTGDWNADGVDTLGIRRGREYHLTNTLRGGRASSVFTYGKTSDDLVVGDWDGNGSDTLGVRRGNKFFLNNTLTGGSADVTFAYGRPDDIVIMGDWDGDGVDTPMVRRGNVYYQTNQLQGGTADNRFGYGKPTDQVYVGDWDGNGTDTLGVRRGNTFYLTNSSSTGSADITFAYGRPSDLVLIGDWDADGRDTIGLRR